MNDLDGLGQLGAAVRAPAAGGGVRVVGLGESTHGTAEFFRLKHRLVEYLVTAHGFRTFAMEASASATGGRRVRTGPGHGGRRGRGPDRARLLDLADP
jgi:erythromycin esterase